ncbi:transposase [Rhodocaloribacter litoris]|nr:transposase [Rhodocaloribacter litoris]QXD14410.1 transposase [Rhodocaloribacter litoris]QXD15781.1 transposase [Rhodocaloribacter litoris]QXD16116.1 transposase [Rhodocaloribacter litoris]
MIAFRPLFSKSVFQHAQVLVAGAILAPGRRTVASALRVMGLSALTTFQNYHRVLNRATWSARRAAQILLTMLIETFHDRADEGPLVFGIDETIERRRGVKINAKGIYRDPVRSSRGHFVKASGLRWLSLMYLPRIPWAERVWALPFLTVLCPSERYHTEAGKQHKKLTDWARQMLLQLKRWLPARPIVVTADSSFSAIEFLAAVGEHVTVVTRLRLDAALYEPAPPRKPGQVGRPRKKGRRLPSLHEILSDEKTAWRRFQVSQWYGREAYEVDVATGCALWYHSGLPVVPLRWVLVRDPAGRLEPKGFLCTDQQACAVDILTWFVRRWSVEVTFEEVRRHLGFETQRQWSDPAILRTTPCLLGLFSLVALMADRLHAEGELTVARSAWYDKPHPTFSDALAGVRMVLWRAMDFPMSHERTEMLKIPRPLFERLTSTLAYAA